MSLAIVGWVIAAIFLALVVPDLAVSVRRLHDHDKPGWFLLMYLFPIFGWLFLFFLMVTPGTVGPNTYGDDPREFVDTAELY